MGRRVKSPVTLSGLAFVLISLNRGVNAKAPAGPSISSSISDFTRKVKGGRL